MLLNVAENVFAANGRCIHSECLLHHFPFVPQCIYIHASEIFYLIVEGAKTSKSESRRVANFIADAAIFWRSGNKLDSRKVPAVCTLLVLHGGTRIVEIGV